MLYRKIQQLEVIEEGTAGIFEQKVNKVLQEIQEAGGTYEITFNTSRGHCAYILRERKTCIPENAIDRHELAGDLHRCVECPFWVHPTKGNVKYTRCEIVRGTRAAKSACCDEFYEMLDKGEITLETEEA